MSRARVRIALAVVLVAAVLPGITQLGAPFLSWDDQRNIAANPYYLHLGWWRLWFQPYFGLYVPVVSSLWATMLRLDGGTSGLFRVLNCALHAANAFLVWRLIASLLAVVAPADERRIPAAALIGTAVFAVHPLQVDATLWISAGRDLLATAFALGAWLVYRRGTARGYWIASGLFTAGLLSKPSIAALPLAIIAFAALFERGRLSSVVRAMSLWIALVVIDAAGTTFMQSEMAPIHSPLVWRPLVALDAAGFYLGKIVWPAAMNVDYGRTPDWVAAHPRAIVVSAASLAALVALVLLSRHRRALVSSLGLAVILLLPVLGFVPFAFQRISTVADHYMYLPMAMVAFAIAVAASVYRSPPPLIVSVLAVLLIAGTAASVARARVWRSDEALFSDALARNPASSVALTNLGRLACERGELARGLDLIGRAVQVHPDEAPAIADKAYCLYHGGNFDEVVEMRGAIQNPALRFSLDHNEDAASSFANTLAGAYFQRRQPREGWLFLCQALALAPYDTLLRQNTADIQQMFAEQGVAARCPSRQRWEMLAAAP